MDKVTGDQQEDRSSHSEVRRFVVHSSIVVNTYRKSTSALVTSDWTTSPPHQHTAIRIGWWRTVLWLTRLRKKMMKLTSC